MNSKNIYITNQKPRNLNKRTFSMLLTTFVLLAVLCSCGSQGGRGKSLREHGLDVVSLMEEMVKNDDYGKLFLSSDDLEAIRKKIAGGDYTSPENVYEISIPSFQEVFSYLGEADAIASLPDSLKKYLDSKSSSTLLNQLNAQEGVAPLAVASVYAAGKTFAAGKQKEDTVYLYTFRDGYPIAVSFTSGEDGTMTASGLFLINEAYHGASPEQLESLLSGYHTSCTVRLLEE